MIGKDVPIAVLPMGTANNISKTLGIADLPLTWLIRSWKTARRVEFDAGHASGPWGERYFIEGIGAGLLTSSIPEVQGNKTMDHLQEAGVKVTYAQQIFREHLEDSPAVEMEATLDGEDISGRYVLFEVLNMKYIGPNLFLGPGRGAQRRRVRGGAAFARSTGSGCTTTSSTGRKASRGRSPSGRTRRAGCEIEWTGFPIHIDDKIWPKNAGATASGAETIDIEVEPKAVTFLVPKDVHDLQKLAAKNGKKEPAKRGKR